MFRLGLAMAELDPLVDLGGSVGGVAGVGHRDRALAAACGGARDLGVGDEGAAVDGGVLDDRPELLAFGGSVAVANADRGGQVAGGLAAAREAVVAVKLGLGQRDLG